ncbi:mitochondrial glycerol-3-phosphate dehydrogenase [Nowakowskiella sp. JEL0078]|nr:mitochondrial glycerol-3-phosphate dehydrogenase [Nowakowskiella sp. JEL0078]
MNFARASGLLSRRSLIGVSSVALVGSTYLWFKPQKADLLRAKDHVDLPSRENILSRLKKASVKSAEFDLLIIGGGATGAGCALDAALRGLNVALVERDDFSSGTSSKSTKLIHGGVRYLEKAFLELDYEQLKLVTEALHERKAFLEIAPHLTYELPIMIPIFTWWKAPYIFAGVKAYDFFAGSKGLSSAYYLTKNQTLEINPNLKKDGLWGSIVYYDGGQNDSRMNVALVQTAIQNGAAAANHVEVVNLLKDDGKVSGAIVRDTITGEEWSMKAKGVINATGPFTDSIRSMDEGTESKDIVVGSSGVHIILPEYYSPPKMGLLEPSTSDGRVVFILPWQGHVLAGTTDAPSEITYSPTPSEEDIQWILNEVQNQFSKDSGLKIRRSDVLAAWSGIRPLVKDPNAKKTEGIVRNHIIIESASGLITIAGGKWTTYRAMAEETIDHAISKLKLQPSRSCVSAVTPLIGANWFSQNQNIQLIQNFKLEADIAEHLANNYGDRAPTIAADILPTAPGRLAPHHPFTDAEVRYVCRHEYALTAADVIARRMRLAFLDVNAAINSLPQVIFVMTEELGWDRKTREREYNTTLKFLETMGLNVQAVTKGDWGKARLNYFRSLFNDDEVEKLKGGFSKVSKVGKKELAVLVGSVVVKVPANLESVLEKAGLADKKDFEFVDVLEVAASLRKGKLN